MLRLNGAEGRDRFIRNKGLLHCLSPRADDDEDGSEIDFPRVLNMSVINRSIRLFL